MKGASPLKQIQGTEVRQQKNKKLFIKGAESRKNLHPFFDLQGSTLTFAAKLETSLILI